MEPKGPLPRLQVPAACPYPEPHQPSPCPITHFLNLLLNIISHLWAVVPSGLFPSGFLTKILYTPLLSPIHATYPVHFIRLDLITWTVLGEEYRTLSSSLHSFLHSPVTSSLIGSNILLNTLFSDTLSLRSSLNVSDHVSYPYKTAGKIIVHYVSILKFG